MFYCRFLILPALHLVIFHEFSNDFVISLHFLQFSYKIDTRQDYRCDMLSYEDICFDIMKNLNFIHIILKNFSDEILASAVGCLHHYQNLLSMPLNCKIHKL